MTYKTLGLFFMIWAIAALVTATVERQDAISDLSGSAGSTTELAQAVYGTDEQTADRPVSPGQNPITAATSIAKTAVGWIGHFFNAAQLKSDIWNGWAAPIKWSILVLQLPMLLLFVIEGAKVLSGYIPFT